MEERFAGWLGRGFAFVVVWLLLLTAFAAYTLQLIVDVPPPITKQQAVETGQAPRGICDNPNITCFDGSQGGPGSDLLPLDGGVVYDGQKPIVTIEPLRLAEWMQDNDK